MSVIMQDLFTPSGFWENHVKNGECWEWKGLYLHTKNSKKQYGRIYYKPFKKSISIHRLAWILHNKQNIPKKMVIMHRCDNTLCYNPDHLAIGTHKDNTQDMIKKGRDKFRGRKPVTRCVNGHEYTPENTRIIVYKNGSKQKKCRQCKREENMRYLLKRKHIMI